MFPWRVSRMRALAAALAALPAACDRPPESATENTLVITPNQIELVAPTTTTAEPTLPPGPPRDYALVDDARLIGANDEPEQWMSYGRTYDEQRFSPLSDITPETIAGLALAWYADLDTNRGQQATPIVVDGVLYVSTAWSKVFAFDAATGQFLWSYDPQVPMSWAVNACCDVVNRGVAVYDGKVFVAALDGLLIALDAATGRPVWQTNTTAPEEPYTITGAPRIVKGMVLIGNSGDDLGVRGYVSAYDTATGKLVWRFWTVPGDPDEGFENDAMERAARTWTGEWWAQGGGGTVWDSIIYDPELDLVFIGVGNGSPWHHKFRSPGGGDNLFLSSIVALKPDDGSYVWHYQTTPGETWNWGAAQPKMLANLTIDGEDRRVLMQAPKNGFFYVLDAATGELISADNYVEVNWAEDIDLETGRPIEVPEARWSDTGVAFLAAPGPEGGHNWHPMAFSPETGLVYIPARETLFPYIPDDDFAPAVIGLNTGLDWSAATLPQDPRIKERALARFNGALIAWDPVAQREVWRAEHGGPTNGGVLATAGGLVFQGTGAGEFIAYRAENGDPIWVAGVQTSVVAAPISYAVDDEQYIALLVGTGGWALSAGEVGRKGAGLPNLSRLLVYKLGGDLSLPPPPSRLELRLNPPDEPLDAEMVDVGAKAYGRFCAVCHGAGGVSGEVLTDLRTSPTLHEPDSWEEIVRGGLLTDYGMPSFARVLDEDASDAVRHYLISRATDDAAAAAQNANN